MMTKKDALTASERRNIDALRAALGDLLESDPMAKDHSDDYTLWRFLGARENDAAKAEAMFRGSMAWRHSVGIDDLWEAKRVRKERDAGDDCFYAGISGTTLDGGPLIVERLGRVDAAGLSANRDVFEKLKKSYVILVERAFRKVREAGGKTQAVVVVDASGLSRSTLCNVGIIKEIAAIGPPNYPEVTSGVYIVNTPWVFAAVWRLVRPLLPRDTAAKVNILGKDGYLATLREKVANEHIPAFLGGGCNLVDEDHDDFGALCKPCPPPGTS